VHRLATLIAEDGSLLQTATRAGSFCRLVSTSANKFFDKLRHPGVEQINKRSPYGTIKSTTKRIRGSSGLSQHDMCAPASRAGGLGIRILPLELVAWEYEFYCCGRSLLGIADDTLEAISHSQKPYPTSLDRQHHLYSKRRSTGRNA
jgi:hypothetical protein